MDTPSETSTYSAELRRALSTDLTEVESCGCVTVLASPDGALRNDLTGLRVVAIAPGLVPQDGLVEDAWDKSFLLFLRETEQVS